MIIPLGTSDWQSAEESIARMRLRNMYLTDDPTSPDNLTRVMRPVLTTYATIGDGPIRGLWRQDGTFGGDWIVVSGDELYRFTPPSTSLLIDSVSSDGYVQFAGSEDRVIAVIDGIAYSTDGATLTEVVMPDDLPVGSVAYINGYFLLSVLDDDKFFFIEPGETDPDPLSYMTAERSPDPIISINIIADEVWLLGSSGPEVWTATGNADLPFQRVSGRVYDDGCSSRDTAVAASVEGFPCLIWVTSAKAVVLAQGSPRRISTESVEELLRSATNLRAWAFRYNRHDFYILTADEFTLAFDLMKKTWSRWDSMGLDNFGGHFGLQTGSNVYAGDSDNGNLYSLAAGISDDGMAVICQIAGKVDVTGKPEPCWSVSAKVNSGWAPDTDTEPLLELRWSDDQGNTWSSYRSASLGLKGQYSKDVVFRSLGMLTRPGRVFEFRFSSLASFRLDYAVVNEA